jgi:hypothetical protein
MNDRCSTCDKTKDTDDMALIGGEWICRSCMPDYFASRKKQNWRKTRSPWRLAGEIGIIALLGLGLGILISPDESGDD